MDEDEKRRIVFERARELSAWLEGVAAPADHLTSTAMVLTAALIVKGSGLVSRDEWMATCASCYDTAPSAVEWERG